MSDHTRDRDEAQQHLFDDKGSLALLDQLLADSRLYRTTQDYRDLLDFVVRLRNFAPFNAMLLQIQKPGLTFAASALDWQERFGRYPKEDARPLLILWPFGPVALVYDLQDTEGKELPQDAIRFVAAGPIDASTVQGLGKVLNRRNIELSWVDAGDGNAGFIRVIQRPAHEKDFTKYAIGLNQNHNPPAQFATLAHELGHLALGHLGADKNLNVPDRAGLPHKKEELEAESVAYLVCHRRGVTPRSQTYLSSFVGASTTLNDLDVYQIMRAAGQVESMLGMAAHTRFAQAKPLRKKPAVAKG